MHIILLGQPLSTNNIYRSHSRFGHPSVYMTPEGKALKQSYQIQAKYSLGNTKPFTGQIAMLVKLYFGDKRSRDIDNYNKILLDSLTGIAYLDDKQIFGLAIEKYYDKQNPRIEISIKEMGIDEQRTTTKTLALRSV